MYKTKVLDFGYNRIYYIIEFDNWLSFFWEIFGQNNPENKTIFLSWAFFLEN